MISLKKGIFVNIIEKTFIISFAVAMEFLPLAQRRREVIATSTLNVFGIHFFVLDQGAVVESNSYVILMESQGDF
jgi:hypothetical protein